MHTVNERSELEKVFWTMFDAAPYDARVRLVSTMRSMMDGADRSAFDRLAGAHPRMDELRKRAKSARHGADEMRNESFGLRAKIRTMSGQIRALNQKIERYKREGIKV